MGSQESKGGYRVLEVLEGSPAHEAALQLFTDFIISVNGTVLQHSEMPFQEIIRRNSNCKITLEVFNIISKETREVKVTPKEWGGEGVLGVSLRFEELQEALDQIIHVTHVQPGSPAELSGIMPQEDYILGSFDFFMKDVDELLIFASCHEQVKLCLYSQKSKQARQVILKGGGNSLGIEVGTGALHTL